MAGRRLTDAWGDRWDARQDGTVAEQNERGPIHFRHQSGREVSAEAPAPLDAMTDDDLLLVLDDALESSSWHRSATRGIDAKADLEGYTNPDRRPGVD